MYYNNTPKECKVFQVAMFFFHLQDCNPLTAQSEKKIYICKYQLHILFFYFINKSREKEKGNVLLLQSLKEISLIDSDLKKV